MRGQAILFLFSEILKVVGILNRLDGIDRSTGIASFLGKNLRKLFGSLFLLGLPVFVFQFGSPQD